MVHVRKWVVSTALLFSLPPPPRPPTRTVHEPGTRERRGEGGAEKRRSSRMRMCLMLCICLELCVICRTVHKSISVPKYTMFFMLDSYTDSAEWNAILIQQRYCEETLKVCTQLIDGQIYVLNNFEGRESRDSSSFLKGGAHKIGKLIFLKNVTTM